MKTLWCLLIAMSSVVQAAIFTTPTNWPSGSSDTNPKVSWAVYTQAASAAYTGSYTLGSYIPYDSTFWFTGYGQGYQAIINTNGTEAAHFLTWSNGGAFGGYGVLAFTVPTSGLATISGTVATDTAVDNVVQVYKLNAGGTTAFPLGEYDFGRVSSSASINLTNVSVVAGDQIMLRWNNNDWSYQHGALTNYTIEIIPEPASLLMLSVGGLVLAGRMRRK